MFENKSVEELSVGASLILDHRAENLDTPNIVHRNRLIAQYPQTKADEAVLFGVEFPKSESQEEEPFLRSKDDYTKEEPKWVEITEKTKKEYESAERIVFQAGPGLGDVHILSGIAILLSIKSPEKEFLLSIPSSMSGVFDATKVPSNLKLLFEGGADEFEDFRSRFENKPQLLISLNDYADGDFRDSDRIKEQIGYDPLLDCVHTTKDFIVHALIDKEKETFKLVDYLRLFNSQLPEKYLNTVTKQPKAPFLSDQMLYRLMFAYGIDFEDSNLEKVRYGLPVDLGLTEEEIKEPQKRMTVVYDSKAGEGKKLLTAQQWADFINFTLAEDSFDSNIDITQGLDNPQLANEILELIHQKHKSRVTIRKFNSLKELEKHLVTSKYVVSVDTVAPHAINNARKTYTIDHPTCIVFYGTNAGFNINEYSLGNISVVSENGIVKDLNMVEVYKGIKKYL